MKDREVTIMAQNRRLEFRANGLSGHERVVFRKRRWGDEMNNKVQSYLHASFANKWELYLVECSHRLSARTSNEGMG